MGLYARAQAGDPDALAALVRQHMPLVQALSKRFSYGEDAFQQGCIGLIKAIRKFREEDGFRFSTYAVPVILGEMRRAAAHTLGWRARAALKKAKAFENRQVRLTGQVPTVNEIAAHAGVRPEELLLLMETSKGPVYDESGLLFSAISDPQGEMWLVRFCIRDILDRMLPEESWLIRQRFLLGKSQMELARTLNMTQSSVSRKEKQARIHFQNAWRGLTEAPDGGTAG